MPAFQLTEEEVAHYHEHGYVIPKDFRVDDFTLERLSDDHQRLLKSAEGSGEDFSDYCGAILPHNLGFANYARDERILDMVSQLIGPDIGLWNMSFFAKPAGIGREVPMHQDAPYWCLNPLATCTVWLALDRSDEENGCLRVIPGSHKSQAKIHHTTMEDPENKLALKMAIDKESFDESQAVNMVLEPGQISLHDLFLVHGSKPNFSGRPRRGMTMRFFPTTSTFERSATSPKVPLLLMRGRDRSEENTASEQLNNFAIGNPSEPLLKANSAGGLTLQERGGVKAKL